MPIRTLPTVVDGDKVQTVHRTDDSHALGSLPHQALPTSPSRLSGLLFGSTPGWSSTAVTAITTGYSHRVTPSRIDGPTRNDGPNPPVHFRVMAQNPEQPPAADSSRHLRVLATVSVTLAMVGLAALALLAVVLGGFFVMGSDNCFEQDTPLICTPDGQDLVFWLPTLGAAAGLVVAAVGCWIWPRRWRAAWLALGYLVALTSLCVSYSIATGNQ